MKFWDPAAVVPLLAEQSGSPAVREWLLEDAELVVWWGTYVECASAIARLERNGGFGAGDAAAARARLDDLRGVWFEVQPVEDIRRHAARLLRVHALRPRVRCSSERRCCGAVLRPPDASYAGRPAGSRGAD